MEANGNSEQLEKSALETKQMQLHWLLQITKAINYNLPSANLFEIYHSVLRDQLHIGRLLLIVNEDGWNIPVQYGVEPDIPFVSASAFAFAIRELSESNRMENDWMKQFDTIIPVLHKDTPLAYALIGGIDGAVFQSKREVITYIHTITNLIVVAIENKRLARESIRQAAMEREMELAAQMQSMLFPGTLVTGTSLDVAATYIPHQSVGGDYYDYIRLNDDEDLVCMADVSGKGISAALLMSNFQANLRALIKHTTSSLEQLIIELNDCVNRSAQGEKYITFFIAIINKREQTIRYVNAGHNPPIVINGHQVTILDKGTTGLGMFDELPFLTQGSLSFPLGSMLFCYTDGITEMENRKGIVFGSDHLSGLLMRHKSVPSMQHLHEIMVRSFNEFRKDIAFNDDVTFLSVRFNH